MLTKFETKSNRVKGLAFHPTRPWILASLHSGTIQLWDYRMGTLIDRFDEHDGPVRGIDFHRTQPLFVSGGDDYKIKVWNYKLRRCIFTLIGHLDYIRTVYFHHESPWLVSASDDQTVRIWNWQNRSCLAVLTGHSHYCMSAMFSPNEDLVVSASLDQTIRVWDIAALRQKSVRPSDVITQISGQLPAAVNADLFGSTDAVVKYVLEGHSRGVNWAAFHPTLPLIVSGADDRQVKLWQMSDTKAWELDTFRGHLNNVSCAMFHPRQELIVTDSEDKSIRVWDLNRRCCLHTFRRESDRFWILAAHPSVNLLAAGHDSGMMVFKLHRERPAYQATEQCLVYTKERYIRLLDFNNGRDMLLVAVRPAAPSMFDTVGRAPNAFSMFGGGSLAGQSAFQPPARSMSYNPAEHAVLLNYDADGGTYELYTNLPRSGTNSSENIVEPRRGTGRSAVFVGRNRFATLEKGREIIVRDLRNQVTKRVPISISGADSLFGAGSGYCLVRSDKKVVLMDLQQRKMTAEIAANAKYAVWSEDNKRLALLGKHVIVLCTNKLAHLATVHETIRVKSAAWDDSGVLLYTTLNHLKYCLPNGDSGIVKTLSQPIYLTRVRGPGVGFIDREGNPGILPIDPTEFSFKLLLLRKRYDDVKRMISQNRLRGQSIIAYLQRKGFPEVALHFVKDEKTRLALALDSGAIDVALEAAQALNEPESFKRLAEEALRQGNLEVFELCLQRTKDLDRLAFLYVITGNFEKLAKVAKIAESRGNLAARFQIAMYLGDVESRVSVLRDCGQTALAKLTAKTHGLDDVVEEMGGMSEDIKPCPNSKPTLMMPPVPVCGEEDHLAWPHLPVARGLFQRDPGAEEDFEEPAGDYYEDAAAFEASERDTKWEDERKASAAPVVDPFAVGLAADDGAVNGDDAWGDDFDVDADLVGDGGDGADNGFGEEEEEAFGGDTQDKPVYYVPPTAGPGVAVRWSRSAKLAGELAASGAFEEAMKLLVQQIGVASFAPMKEPFMSVYAGCRGSLDGAPSMPLNTYYIPRPSAAESCAMALSLPQIREKFKLAQHKFQQARFADATKLFLSILASIPLLVVSSNKEVEDVKKALHMSREYVIGLRLDGEGRKAKAAGDVARHVQLAGLFTRCNMAAGHVALALRVAMKTSFDARNFAHAAGFARRLLELGPPQALAQRARRVIQLADSNMTNTHEIDYDERRDFVVDCATLTPLYAGDEREVCSYCGAVHHHSHKGGVCSICGIGEVGGRAEGLRVYA